MRYKTYSYKLLVFKIEVNTIRNIFLFDLFPNHIYEKLFIYLIIKKLQQVNAGVF